MPEASLPEHIMNSVEAYAPWDMFLIDASEGTGVQFIHMDEEYPELEDY